MCLYPRIIENKKYKPNKKNGGKVPEPTDDRVRYVPIGCGKCMECRKQKANGWRTRLSREFQDDKQAKFVTLTFSDEQITLLEKEFGSKDANFMAKKAVRRFLERWRKKYTKSVKHWLITELGDDETTGRIHLHGIIWTDKTKEEIEDRWMYGKTWIGEYVNNKTINYIVKYVTKIDLEHKGFEGKIMTSAGIGKGYINSRNAYNNRYKKNGQTDESYRLPQGNKTGLPIYYRNHIYTEEEREMLWIEKLNKKTRYINGSKIDISENLEEYEKVLKAAQQKNKWLGFGDDSAEWKYKAYRTRLIKVNKNVSRETK